jgi:hypothetical protein
VNPALFCPAEWPLTVFLETSDDPAIANPDDASIARTLGRLAAGGLEWVALTEGGRHGVLLSAARGRRGLIVELVAERVRRCQRQLAVEAVAAAFTRQLRGDTQWQLLLLWEDVTNESWWVYLVMLAGTVVAALMLIPRLVGLIRHFGAQ